MLRTMLQSGDGPRTTPPDSNPTDQPAQQQIDPRLDLTPDPALDPAAATDAAGGADSISAPLGSRVSESGLVRSADEWLSSITEDWPNWAQFIIVVALFVAGFILIQRLVWWIMRRASRRDRFSAARHLVSHTSTSACVLAAGLGLSVALGIADGREILPGFLDGWWGQAVTVVNVLAITWLVIGAVAGLDDLILARYRIDVRDNLQARRVHTQVKVISRTLMILIGIIGFALALLTFENVGKIGASLLASAGIAGIAVGFAAKPVLGNIIAGIQIALTQPIRLDDAVVIAGEWGWIEEITTTYVVVRVWDQRRLIVPFSKIIEEPFQNWTRNSADILGAVIIHVDYSCPVDELRDELERILDGHPKWDKRGKALQVVDCTERTMTIRVLATAADSPTAWELRCDIRERLIAFLQQKHPWALPREREQKLDEDDLAAERSRRAPQRPRDLDDPTFADAPPPPPPVSKPHDAPPPDPDAPDSADAADDRRDRAKAAE